MNAQTRDGSILLAGGAVAVLLPVGALVGFATVAGGAQAYDAQVRQACSAQVVPAAGAPTSVPTSAAVPSGSVAGYSGPQLANAAEILRAGRDQGLSVRDRTIGVMTAMGESGLRVLDRGDVVGPDSRGLFQQRANGAWGTFEDRMNPYRSSWNFFTALKQVLGREVLSPTLVAHRVQRNADPYHYERYWAPAVAVVERVEAGSVPSSPSGPGAVSLADCPDPSGAGGANGGDMPVTGAWGQPGAGPVMSSFGLRTNPLTGDPGNMHTGIDLAAGGCEGPIWAAAGGTVSTVYMDSLGGWTVHIDHGGGVTTGYKHMYPRGIFVRAGEQVQAGQRIAAVGSSGFSTGCHLHFEVILNGTKVNPAPFMDARGVRLGTI